MFSILLAATLASAAAPQLDAQDAGAYMLVRHDGELSRNFISKLQRDGSRWNMYQRKGDGSWTIVTCEEGCVLQDSTPEQIATLAKGTELPADRLACVQNASFAFCRESRPDRKPAYYVVGFVDGGAIAVPHVRLDPVTLEPVESP